MTAPAAPVCRCCGGAKEVLGIRGEIRPCSRCSIHDFRRWYDSQLPPRQNEAKP